MPAETEGNGREAVSRARPEAAQDALSSSRDRGQTVFFRFEKNRLAECPAQRGRQDAGRAQPRAGGGYLGRTDNLGQPTEAMDGRGG